MSTAAAGSGRHRRPEQRGLAGTLRLVRTKRTQGLAKRASVPSKKGWRGPGGGSSVWVDAPVEWRGTSVQVCGLWPFSAGSGTPVIGAPLGRHLHTGSTVCGDPVNWFLSRLIANPSMFVLGRPGLGKSSLVRHIAALLPAWGITPIVLSDLKPDYSDLIAALDGQVIRVGRGRGNVNPLDPGPLAGLLEQLPEAQRREAYADIEGRRINVMTGLCELARGGTLKELEQTVLTTALRILDDEHDGVPVIRDLRELIDEGHPRLDVVAQSRGDRSRYQARVEPLIDTLISLDDGGPFGDTLSRPTSTPIQLDRPVSFDMSAVEDSDLTLQAALQLVCWSYGSSAVSAAKWLATAGLAPQRVYFLIMDELWRVLRASSVMIDRVDTITRLNRQRALAQALITHTMADLKMKDAADTMKAWGFVERSEMVFLGGLATGEMGNLREVFAMSKAEENLLTSWSEEVGLSGGRAGDPPGLGCFLLKTGKRPGIPFRVELVGIEKTINDTNQHWKDLGASRNRPHEEAEAF